MRSVLYDNGIMHYVIDDVPFQVVHLNHMKVTRRRVVLFLEQGYVGAYIETCLISQVEYEHYLAVTGVFHLEAQTVCQIRVIGAVFVEDSLHGSGGDIEAKGPRRIVEMGRVDANHIDNVHRECGSRTHCVT